ncbi:MAG: hypothetical protein KDD47_28125, partial [Acidobacteria bacterium]|nr:hypothetical protein [Acidobacteriota bacterium]
TDLDGTPRAGEGSWRLLRLRQPERPLLPADEPMPPPEPGWEKYQTAGDRLPPRWQSGDPSTDPLRRWDDGEKVTEGTLRHGADGLGTIELPDLADGAYRLRYATKDELGALFETETELIVAPDTSGAKGGLALPLALLAERSAVEVGSTARILVHSALDDQPLVFERYRQGKRVERRLLNSSRAPQVLEIPVTPEDRGGFSVQLSTLEDYQPMIASRQIFVPWSDRRLQLEFATFRDKVRPGSRETWRLVVRGADEEALAEGTAEVLAFMFDRSLEIFAPHQPFDPLSLYPTSWFRPQVWTSLGAGGEVWQSGEGLGRVTVYPYLLGDRLKFYDGYAIGGMGVRRSRLTSLGAVPAPAAKMAMPDRQDLAYAAEAAPEAEESVTLRGGSPRQEEASPPPPSPPEPEEPIRSDFAETAFWYPHLTTGPDGSVAIEVEVPDSVTEWSLWTLALTRDLRAGVMENRLRSVKELLVRPYLPRFLREGDQADLKVVVNNAGDAAFSGKLDFRVEDPESGEDLSALFGLTSEQALGRSFEIEPGGSAELTFAVTAPRRLGTVAFRAVGRAGDWSD